MRIEATALRVEKSTPRHINEMIRRETECSLLHYAQRPELIEARLAELDQEWDIERTLEVQASGAVLTGLVFSVLRGRLWLGLSIFSGYFLLQHALQGWCPPVALFRRLRIRTAREIETERCALKALRGDFGDLNNSRDQSTRIEAALRAAEGHCPAPPRSLTPDTPLTSRASMPVERETFVAGRGRAPDEPRRAGGRHRERGESAGPPGFIDGV
jgi:hypothetical protein